ncbi:MAG: M20 family metallopeptidase [Syntrophobacteraceae bacterium]
MIKSIDVIEMTQRMVRAQSINPTGDTRMVAQVLAEALEPAGFRLTWRETPGKGVNLVAVLKGEGRRPPLCFTGHMDTVPLGEVPWTVDPFGGEIRDGKLYGRGASDMKSGLAAIAAAGIDLSGVPRRASDVVLIFTAGEETGCEGAKDLAESGLLPSGAGALVVGEPTDCRPLLGHKGALWLRVDFFGRGAHGSMPEAGDNAVYKAARAALALENFLATYPSHPLLGNPTINVGTIGGGGKVNMVPDAAFLEIDLRTIPGLDHHNLENSVQDVLGPAAKLTRLIDVPSVLTPQDDPWISSALDILKRLRGSPQAPGTVSYFTDASILYSALGSPPTLIYGPGAARQAHQTDEHCHVPAIIEAREAYAAIAGQWLSG